MYDHSFPTCAFLSFFLSFVVVVVFFVAVVVVVADFVSIIGGLRSICATKSVRRSTLVSKTNSDRNGSVCFRTS